MIFSWRDLLVILAVVIGAVAFLFYVRLRS